MSCRKCFVACRKCFFACQKCFVACQLWYVCCHRFYIPDLKFHFFSLLKISVPGRMILLPFIRYGDDVSCKCADCSLPYGVSVRIYLNISLDMNCILDLKKKYCIYVTVNACTVNMYVLQS